MTVAIYCRISDDPAGLALGVQRQEADCRALVARSGWGVAYVAVDNDISAYRPTVRPEYERILRDLGAGLIDGMVVYDYDRLARRPSDLERLIDLYDQRPLKFGTVTMEADLSTPDGRFIARLMVNFANKSSADTSRRVARKKLELAEQGKLFPIRRPFGYQDDKVTVKIDEADALRKAAEDVIGGYPLHAVARRWNEAGLLTPYGNGWVQSTVRNTLKSPHLAGYQVYQGKVLYKDGQPVRSQREPILDMPTWEALQTTLKDPKRFNGKAHIGARKRLLGGLVRCGLCGKVMSSDRHVRENIHIYSCKAPTARGGCGKIVVSGPRLDELIEALVLRYLEHRVIRREVAPWTGQVELDQVQARITELMAAFGSGDLSSEVVFPTVKRLEERAAELKSEQATFLTALIQANEPEDVVKAWPTYEFEQKRLVLERLIEAVIVKPAPRKGGRFRPERIEVVWKEAGQARPTQPQSAPEPLQAAG